MTATLEVGQSVRFELDGRAFHGVIVSRAPSHMHGGRECFWIEITSHPLGAMLVTPCDGVSIRGQAS